MTKHFQSSSIFKEFVFHESLKHYQFSILNCSLCLLKDLPNHWIDISFPVLMYTTVQRFGVRNICFWKKLMDALNWWKVTIKTFMLQKISISNKCCSSEPSIHQKKKKKKNHKNNCSENLEQQISIRKNQKWFLKDHVTLKPRVMAEKNSALHQRNKLHFKI